jgi:hypothetical protein
MAFCCQLLLLPHTATSRYCCRHCCHCLSRGSSGGAGVAACGGGSGSSSSVGSGGGGSGAILFLVVVVILLLFACPLLVGIVLPLFVARCSFRRPPLARFQRTMIGCCLLRSRSLSCCGGVVARARPVDLCPQQILTPAPPPPPPRVRHCPTASGRHHPLLPPPSS